MSTEIVRSAEPGAAAFSRLENLYIATTRGPCGGVNDSIEILDKAVTLVNQLRPGIQVYCLHEIVHNIPILNYFRQERGVVFTENPQSVESQSVVIINAHGQPQWAAPYLKEEKGCFVIDTTCPFVLAIHVRVDIDVANRYHIVLFGDPKHAEAIAIASRVPEGRLTIVQSIGAAKAVSLPTDVGLAFHTQTTAAGYEAEEVEDILRQRFPHTRTTPRGDRCNAVKVRQEAVCNFADVVDLAIIVGSPTSKNTKNMTKVAERYGIPAIRTDEATEIDMKLLAQVRPVNIGLSSGASVLDDQFMRVKDWLAHQARSHGCHPNEIYMDPVGSEKSHFRKQEEIYTSLISWLQKQPKFPPITYPAV